MIISESISIINVIPEPPEVPNQLEVVGVDTKWVEFRWNPVKVHVTHYVLQMCINPCTDWSNYTIGGSLSYTKISYLKPATMYITRIIAINDFGSSNPSLNSTITTLEDSKLHNIFYYKEFVLYNYISFQILMLLQII